MNSNKPSSGLSGPEDSTIPSSSSTSQQGASGHQHLINRNDDRHSVSTPSDSPYTQDLTALLDDWDTDENSDDLLEASIQALTRHIPLGGNDLHSQGAEEAPVSTTAGALSAVDWGSLDEPSKARLIESIQAFEESMFKYSASYELLQRQKEDEIVNALSADPAQYRAVFKPNKTGSTNRSDGLTQALRARLDFIQSLQEQQKHPQAVEILLSMIRTMSAKDVKYIQDQIHLGRVIDIPTLPSVGDHRFPPTTPSQREIDRSEQSSDMSDASDTHSPPPPSHGTTPGTRVTIKDLLPELPPGVILVHSSHPSQLYDRLAQIYYETSYYLYAASCKLISAKLQSYHLNSIVKYGFYLEQFRDLYQYGGFSACRDLLLDLRTVSTMHLFSRISHPMLMLFSLFQSTTSDVFDLIARPQPHYARLFFDSHSNQKPPAFPQIPTLKPVLIRDAAEDVSSPSEEIQGQMPIPTYTVSSRAVLDNLTSLPRLNSFLLMALTAAASNAKLNFDYRLYEENHSQPIIDGPLLNTTKVAEAQRADVCRRGKAFAAIQASEQPETPCNTGHEQTGQTPHSGDESGATAIILSDDAIEDQAVETESYSDNTSIPSKKDLYLVNPTYAITKTLLPARLYRVLDAYIDMLVSFQLNRLAWAVTYVHLMAPTHQFTRDSRQSEVPTAAFSLHSRVRASSPCYMRRGLIPPQPVPSPFYLYSSHQQSGGDQRLTDSSRRRNTSSPMGHDDDALDRAELDAVTIQFDDATDVFYPTRGTTFQLLSSVLEQSDPNTLLATFFTDSSPHVIDLPDLPHPRVALSTTTADTVSPQPPPAPPPPSPSFKQRDALYMIDFDLTYAISNQASYLHTPLNRDVLERSCTLLFDLGRHWDIVRVVATTIAKCDAFIRFIERYTLRSPSTMQRSGEAGQLQWNYPLLYFDYHIACELVYEQTDNHPALESHADSPLANQYRHHPYIQMFVHLLQTDDLVLPLHLPVYPVAIADDTPLSLPSFHQQSPDMVIPPSSPLTSSVLTPRVRVILHAALTYIYDHRISAFSTTAIYQQEVLRGRGRHVFSSEQQKWQDINGIARPTLTSARRSSTSADASTTAEQEDILTSILPSLHLTLTTSGSSSLLAGSPPTPVPLLYSLQAVDRLMLAGYSFFSPMRSLVYLLQGPLRKGHLLSGILTTASQYVANSRSLLKSILPDPPLLEDNANMETHMLCPPPPSSTQDALQAFEDLNNIKDVQPSSIGDSARVSLLTIRAVQAFLPPHSQLYGSPALADATPMGEEDHFEDHSKDQSSSSLMLTVNSGYVSAVPAHYYQYVAWALWGDELRTSQQFPIDRHHSQHLTAHRTTPIIIVSAYTDLILPYSPQAQHCGAMPPYHISPLMIENTSLEMSSLDHNYYAADIALAYATREDLIPHRILETYIRTLGLTEDGETALPKGENSHHSSTYENVQGYEIASGGGIYKTHFIDEALLNRYTLLKTHTSQSLLSTVFSPIAETDVLSEYAVVPLVCDAPRRLSDHLMLLLKTELRNNRIVRCMMLLRTIRHTLLKELSDDRLVDSCLPSSPVGDSFEIQTDGQEGVDHFHPNSQHYANHLRAKVMQSVMGQRSHPHPPLEIASISTPSLVDILTNPSYVQSAALLTQTQFFIRLLKLKLELIKRVHELSLYAVSPEGIAGGLPGATVAGDSYIYAHGFGFLSPIEAMIYRNDIGFTSLLRTVAMIDQIEREMSGVTVYAPSDLQYAQSALAGYEPGSDAFMQHIASQIPNVDLTHVLGSSLAYYLSTVCSHALSPRSDHDTAAGGIDPASCDNTNNSDPVSSHCFFCASLTTRTTHLPKFALLPSPPRIAPLDSEQLDACTSANHRVPFEEYIQHTSPVDPLFQIIHIKGAPIPLLAATLRSSDRLYLRTMLLQKATQYYTQQLDQWIRRRQVLLQLLLVECICKFRLLELEHTWITVNRHEYENPPTLKQRHAKNTQEYTFNKQLRAMHDPQRGVLDGGSTLDGFRDALDITEHTPSGTDKQHFLPLTHTHGIPCHQDDIDMDDSLPALMPDTPDSISEMSSFPTPTSPHHSNHSHHALPPPKLETEHGVFQRPQFACSAQTIKHIRSFLHQRCLYLESSPPSLVAEGMASCDHALRGIQSPQVGALVTSMVDNPFFQALCGYESSMYDYDQCRISYPPASEENKTPPTSPVGFTDSQSIHVRNIPLRLEKSTLFPQDLIETCSPTTFLNPLIENQLAFHAYYHYSQSPTSTSISSSTSPLSNSSQQSQQGHQGSSLYAVGSVAENNLTISQHFIERCYTTMCLLAGYTALFAVMTSISDNDDTPLFDTASAEQTVSREGFSSVTSKLPSGQSGANSVHPSFHEAYPPKSPICPHPGGDPTKTAIAYMSHNNYLHLAPVPIHGNGSIKGLSSQGHSEIQSALYDGCEHGINISPGDVVVEVYHGPVYDNGYTVPAFQNATHHSYEAYYSNYVRKKEIDQAHLVLHPPPTLPDDQGLLALVTPTYRSLQHVQLHQPLLHSLLVRINNYNGINFYSNNELYHRYIAWREHLEAVSFPYEQMVVNLTQFDVAITCDVHQLMLATLQTALFIHSETLFWYQLLSYYVKHHFLLENPQLISAFQTRYPNSPPPTFWNLSDVIPRHLHFVMSNVQHLTSILVASQPISHIKVSTKGQYKREMASMPLDVPLFLSKFTGYYHHRGGSTSSARGICLPLDIYSCFISGQTGHVNAIAFSSLLHVSSCTDTMSHAVLGTDDWSQPSCTSAGDQNTSHNITHTPTRNTLTNLVQLPCIGFHFPTVEDILQVIPSQVQWLFWYVHGHHYYHDHSFSSQSSSTELLSSRSSSFPNTTLNFSASIDDLERSSLFRNYSTLATFVSRQLDADPHFLLICYHYQVLFDGCGVHSQTIQSAWLILSLYYNNTYQVNRPLASFLLHDVHLYPVTTSIPDAFSAQSDHLLSPDEDEYADNRDYLNPQSSTVHSSLLPLDTTPLDGSIGLQQLFRPRFPIDDTKSRAYTTLIYQLHNNLVALMHDISSPAKTSSPLADNQQPLFRDGNCSVSPWLASTILPLEFLGQVHGGSSMTSFQGLFHSVHRSSPLEQTAYDYTTRSVASIMLTFINRANVTRQHQMAFLSSDQPSHGPTSFDSISSGAEVSAPPSRLSSIADPPFVSRVYLFLPSTPKFYSFPEVNVSDVLPLSIVPRLDGINNTTMTPNSHSLTHPMMKHIQVSAVLLQLARSLILLTSSPNLVFSVAFRPTNLSFEKVLGSIIAVPVATTTTTTSTIETDSPSIAQIAPHLLPARPFYSSASPFHSILSPDVLTLTSTSSPSSQSPDQTGRPSQPAAIPAVQPISGPMCLSVDFSSYCPRGATGIHRGIHLPELGTGVVSSDDVFAVFARTDHTTVHQLHLTLSTQIGTINKYRVKSPLTMAVQRLEQHVGTKNQSCSIPPRFVRYTSLSSSPTSSSDPQPGHLTSPGSNYVSLSQQAAQHVLSHYRLPVHTMESRLFLVPVIPVEFQSHHPPQHTMFPTVIPPTTPPSPPSMQQVANAPPTHHESINQGANNHNAIELAKRSPFLPSPFTPPSVVVAPVKALPSLRPSFVRPLSIHRRKKGMYLYIFTSDFSSPSSADMEPLRKLSTFCFEDSDRLNLEPISDAHYFTYFLSPKQYALTTHLGERAMVPWNFYPSAFPHLERSITPTLVRSMITASYSSSLANTTPYPTTRMRSREGRVVAGPTQTVPFYFDFESFPACPPLLYIAQLPHVPSMLALVLLKSAIYHDAWLYISRNRPTNTPRGDTSSSTSTVTEEKIASILPLYLQSLSIPGFFVELHDNRHDSQPFRLQKKRSRKQRLGRKKLLARQKRQSAAGVVPEENAEIAHNQAIKVEPGTTAAARAQPAPQTGYGLHRKALRSLNSQLLTKAFRQGKTDVKEDQRQLTLKVLGRLSRHQSSSGAQSSLPSSSLDTGSSDSQLQRELNTSARDAAPQSLLRTIRRVAEHPRSAIQGSLCDDVVEYYTSIHGCTSEFENVERLLSRYLCGNSSHEDNARSLQSGLRIVFHKLHPSDHRKPGQDDLQHIQPPQECLNHYTHTQHHLMDALNAKRHQSSSHSPTLCEILAPSCQPLTCIGCLKWYYSLATWSISSDIMASCYPLFIRAIYTTLMATIVGSQQLYPHALPSPAISVSSPHPIHSSTRQSSNQSPPGPSHWFLLDPDTFRFTSCACIYESILGCLHEPTCLATSPHRQACIPANQHDMTMVQTASFIDHDISPLLDSETVRSIIATHPQLVSVVTSPLFLLLTRRVASMLRLYHRQLLAYDLSKLTLLVYCAHSPLFDPNLPWTRVTSHNLRLLHLFHPATHQWFANSGQLSLPSTSSKLSQVDLEYLRHLTNPNIPTVSPGHSPHPYSHHGSPCITFSTHWSAFYHTVQHLIDTFEDIYSNHVTVSMLGLSMVSSSPQHLAPTQVVIPPHIRLHSPLSMQFPKGVDPALYHFSMTKMYFQHSSSVDMLSELLSLAKLFVAGSHHGILATGLFRPVPLFATQSHSHNLPPAVASPSSINLQPDFTQHPVGPIHVTYAEAMQYLHHSLNCLFATISSGIPKLFPFYTSSSTHQGEAALQGTDGLGDGDDSQDEDDDDDEDEEGEDDDDKHKHEHDHLSLPFPQGNSSHATPHEEPTPGRPESPINVYCITHPSTGRSYLLPQYGVNDIASSPGFSHITLKAIPLVLSTCSRFIEELHLICTSMINCYLLSTNISQYGYGPIDDSSPRGSGNGHHSGSLGSTPLSEITAPPHALDILAGLLWLHQLQLTRFSTSSMNMGIYLRQYAYVNEIQTIHNEMLILCVVRYAAYFLRPLLSSTHALSSMPVGILDGILSQVRQTLEANDYSPSHSENHVARFNNIQGILSQTLCQIDRQMVAASSSSSSPSSATAVQQFIQACAGLLHSYLSPHSVVTLDLSSRDQPFGLAPQPLVITHHSTHGLVAPQQPTAHRPLLIPSFSHTLSLISSLGSDFLLSKRNIKYARGLRGDFRTWTAQLMHLSRYYTHNHPSSLFTMATHYNYMHYHRLTAYVCSTTVLTMLSKRISSLVESANNPHSSSTRGGVGCASARDIHPMHPNALYSSNRSTTTLYVQSLFQAILFLESHNMFQLAFALWKQHLPCLRRLCEF